MVTEGGGIEIGGLIKSMWKECTRSYETIFSKWGYSERSNISKTPSSLYFERYIHNYILQH